MTDHTELSTGPAPHGPHSCCGQHALHTRNGARRAVWGLTVAMGTTSVVATGALALAVAGPASATATAPASDSSGAAASQAVDDTPPRPQPPATPSTRAQAGNTPP